MRNGSVIRPGDVQRMSAAMGVTRSQHDASADETLHLLEIWRVPTKRGLTPSSAQRNFTSAEKQGRRRRVASPDGEGSVTIHADGELYVGLFAAAERASLALGRNVWVHFARGRVRLNGQGLGPATRPRCRKRAPSSSKVSRAAKSSSSISAERWTLRSQNVERN